MLLKVVWGCTLVEGCEEPLVALACLLASFVFSLLEGGLLYYLFVRLEGRLGAQATKIDRHRHELLRSCRLLNHIFNIVFVVVVAEYLSGVRGLEGVDTVSYTHLTLPTKA